LVGGASIDPLGAFHALLLHSHIPRPKSSIMKLTTPKPTPIAAPVLNDDAWLELPAGPKGAASITLAHVPLEHILSLAQSPSEAQVALAESAVVIALAASSDVSAVGLGVGALVSSCIRLNCCSRVVDFGVCLDEEAVVADCRLEVVADSRFDVADVIVGSCRRLLDVVDIIIIRNGYMDVTMDTVQPLARPKLT
jgi:hypothetical protein